jgi:hypothetical protein
LPNLPNRDQADGILAAPLIADTGKRYETQLARKETEIATREVAIRQQQDQIALVRQSIDSEVAAKLDQERDKIAATEAQKARRIVATDLETKTKEIADLNQVLKQRDAKLAEAQQAQADLMRKQRKSQSPQLKGGNDGKARVHCFSGRRSAAFPLAASAQQSAPPSPVRQDWLDRHREPALEPETATTSGSGPDGATCWTTSWLTPVRP